MVVSGGREVCGKLAGKIREVAGSIERDVRLMEVCGTHTQVVARYGIRSVLPSSVKLVSGPGCPVCVTAQRDIDCVVELALSGVKVATYGDMMRVPGSRMSLGGARAEGACVEVVCSVVDALRMCKDGEDVVFFGVGFETTAPMSAVALKKGLCVYSVHKTMPAAMKMLLSMDRVNIDGFINPGNVSAIIGSSAYKGIDAAQVITGFEAVDVLASVLMLLLQIRKGERKVENEYNRVVSSRGNRAALGVIDEVFEAGDADWRGLGVVPGSGLGIRREFGDCDAKVRFSDVLGDVREPKSDSGCRCGEVLTGVIEPHECGLFGKKCRPECPRGACMVSGEGACSIAYKCGC